MFNAVAKSLVLVQALLSLAGMSWAMMLVLQSRDLGWAEPAKEVLETNADGTPSTKPGSVVRFASEYDKSVVAVQEAAKSRDRIYRHVKPALDLIADTENYVWENHRFYVKEMARVKELRSDQDKKDAKPFKVFRLKDGGTALAVTKAGNLGIPIFEPNEVAKIEKPYKEYKADHEALLKELEVYDGKMQKVADLIKKITFDMTGTDEVTNAYIQPGLPDMTSMEFKYQRQIKVEIDAIKQDWSKAIESSGTFRLRRIGLEKTLEMHEAPPVPRKDNKKL